ncbi:MAG TPA: BON domain-containing protein [Anaerolineaceae bacterium]|jgi:osmotically-inducible protein OsmY|nr:BON domain-containing protein [Anaerolineaceae bacterium]
MIQQPVHVTDESLRAVILAGLATDHQTAGVDLRVGVLNGIAHLAGKVDSLIIRTTAERLARQVSGIRGVVNRIEAPGAPSPARPIHLDLDCCNKDERIDT